MSDITNTSLASQIAPPEHSSTLKDSFYLEKNCIKQKEIKDNRQTNTETNNAVKTNYNDLTAKFQNQHNSNLSTTDPGKKIQVINVVNDLTKGQSCTVERNLILGSSNPGKSNRPIMGRSALLKKANIDKCDSVIVHDLIIDKYNGIMNHYFDRMCQRRRSRIESSDEESSDVGDTVFSTLPKYSPPTRSRINLKNEKNEQGFSFIRSTDDINAETTFESNDMTSITSSDMCDITSSPISDYDPKKFLDEALGEVLDNSEFLKDEPKKPRHIVSYDDQSIETSDISELLSRASAGYVSMAKSPKQRSHHNIEDLPYDDGGHADDVSIMTGRLLDCLRTELAVQTEITLQISKALTLCRTSKEFVSGIEHIEAEKILLAATCTKDALLKEITNIELHGPEKGENPVCNGNLEIFGLKFPPKQQLNVDESPDVHRDFTQHFLCVLMSGKTVLASEVTVADSKGAVNIKKRFEFFDLPWDFEIFLCVYSMKVKNKDLNKEPKHICPSPKRLFKLHKSSRKYKIVNDISLRIRPSSFTLWGQCTIRSGDLSKIRKINSENIPLIMQNAPLCSSLSPSFYLKIKTEPIIKNKISGFLTIAIDNEKYCIVWNRRWCILDGLELRYWNYPSEEACDPIGNILLSRSVDDKISLADRSICAKPRTLLLPIIGEDSLKKYLLSADNVDDLKRWKDEINFILISHKMWN